MIVCAYRGQEIDTESSSTLPHLTEPRGGHHGGLASPLVLASPALRLQTHAAEPGSHMVQYSWI